MALYRPGPLDDLQGRFETIGRANAFFHVSDEGRHAMAEQGRKSMDRFTFTCRIPPSHFEKVRSTWDILSVGPQKDSTPVRTGTAGDRSCQE